MEEYRPRTDVVVKNTFLEFKEEQQQDLGSKASSDPTHSRSSSASTSDSEGVPDMRTPRRRASATAQADEGLPPPPFGGERMQLRTEQRAVMAGQLRSQGQLSGASPASNIPLTLANLQNLEAEAPRGSRGRSDVPKTLTQEGRPMGVEMRAARGGGGPGELGAFAANEPAFLSYFSSWPGFAFGSASSSTPAASSNAHEGAEPSCGTASGRTGVSEPVAMGAPQLAVEPRVLSAARNESPPKATKTKEKKKKAPSAARHLAAALQQTDHWSLTLPSIGTAKHMLPDLQCEPCINYLQRKCKKGVNCPQCHDISHKGPTFMSL
mmetsp:Transcript_102782/g.331635  ORF Transcript_102782/g.331635 Transcript_102782/m.331635 type:complete len:323 (+) Transcript_102782:93-1061(+)